jgi:phosphatidylglycerophosphate synthase
MSHDTWLHRIARPGARLLARTPVTPNQVTTARLVLGLAATGLFALGPAWNTAAGLAYLASMIFDRMDGVLARLTGKSTPWGHKYDLAVDAICDAVVFMGIGWGLRDGPLGDWAVVLGVVAGLAVSAVFWLVFRVEALEGPRAAELGARAGFDPDDGLLAVPLAAFLGLTQPLLIAAAALAPLFTAFMFWKFRTALRRA